jgi:hypothetical protein
LRRDFGLHELEQEMEKLGRYKRLPAAPVNLHESVRSLAETLKQIGNDVLNGDFGVLLARLRHHVEAVENNSSHAPP